jgi:hypothetical protein
VKVNKNGAILNGTQDFHLLFCFEKSPQFLTSPIPNNTLQYTLLSLKMLRLPNLAILMVVIFGHAFGQQTPKEILKSLSIAIPMLAEFDTEIFSPLKVDCEKLDSELCKSVKALDPELLEFGKMIMQQMNIGELGTNEKGHSVSQL